MEALFIENTSQAIKDYFNKKHESTIATSAQKSSNRVIFEHKPSQNMYTQDCQYTVDDMTNNGQHNNEEEGDTAITSTTDQRDDNHSLVINGENEKKYSRIDDSLPNRAFIIEAKCGKFKSLTISLWKSLERVRIDDSCCSKCKNVFIAFCPKLLSINIGKSSFSSAKLDIQGDFFIFLLYIDCHKLEEISFGEYSFGNSQSLSLHSMLPNLVSK